MGGVPSLVSRGRREVKAGSHKEEQQVATKSSRRLQFLMCNVSLGYHTGRDGRGNQSKLNGFNVVEVEKTEKSLITATHKKRKKRWRSTRRKITRCHQTNGPVLFESSDR